MDFMKELRNKNVRQNIHWESSDQFLRKRWIKRRISLPSN